MDTLNEKMHSRKKNNADFPLQFGGVLHLYGEKALERFRQAHVCIIGVGGVGSWAVEALARSGIGRLTLVDPDSVVETNMNRQIQAMQDSLGQAKARVLAERILRINPDCQVNEMVVKVTIENPAELFDGYAFDYVIDAIDDMFAKTALIDYCSKKGIPIVTVGGAGGQMDPTRIKIGDLSQTEQEPLLARVRKRLRQKYAFPRGKRSFGIDAVYSTEPLRYPDSELFTSKEDTNEATRFRFGTTVTVTASFGMAAASLVLRRLARHEED